MIVAKIKETHKAEEYAKLGAEGMTYRAIADMYGCSYQNICQHLAGIGAGHFRAFTEKRCVFDGLREWMNANECTTAELLRRLYGRNPPPATNTRWAKIMQGKTELRKQDIDNLIRVTGRSYEDLFRLGSVNE